VNHAADDIPSDGELVRRAQAGESAAFDVLMMRYQDRVYNTCYRMCNNREDAADLTQSTFLRAYEALGRFRTEARFFTWLYRIAVNLALTHRRRARLRRTLSLVGSDEQRAGHEPVDAHQSAAPSNRLQAQEQQRLLAEALAQLDEEYRAAVVLRDIEGLDYAAIAEILDVPVGTVKSRIFRGRMMLREMLETAEEHERDAG